ncbi:MAG: hypothetical protein GC145_06295 [Caulobacter sp.]|nr:hypothetical protein [Caulobacter sp.]
MNRPRLLLAIAAVVLWPLLTAGSCATTGAAEPKVEVRIADVPVVVHCEPDPGPLPAYPDSDEALLSAPGLFEQVQLLLAGRKLKTADLKADREARRRCAGWRPPDPG